MGLGICISKGDVAAAIPGTILGAPLFQSLSCPNEVYRLAASASWELVRSEGLGPHPAPAESEPECDQASLVSGAHSEA